MTKKSLQYMKWGFIMICFHIHLNGRNVSIDLLPDFVGMLLLYLSLKSRQEETVLEKRLEPLYLILAAEALIRWIWKAQNGVLSLFITVVHIFTVYVYLKEVQKRIVKEQPQNARSLEGIALGYVVLQVLHYFFGAYEILWMMLLISVGFVVLLVWMLVTLFRITPQEGIDGSGQN